MIYLFDLLFVMGYLIVRRVFRLMHEADVNVFISIRGIIGWCEFAYVMIWFYFLLPHHNMTEGAVGFGMCFFTKLVFQYVTAKENFFELFRKPKPKT